MKKYYIISLLIILSQFSCEKESENDKGQHLGVEWIRINSGLTFQMGDSFGGGAENEYPVHTVTIDPYSISKYEISNKQYCQFLNEAQEAGKVMYSETKYQFKGVAKGAGSVEGDTLYLHIDVDHWYYQFEYIDGKFCVKEGLENRPVIVVTWAGANAFARFYGWRLPTEAEWERAARGPDPGYMFPWGNEAPDCEKANYGLWDRTTQIKCADETVDVTCNEAGKSPEGCYNMAGNVHEMCHDFFHNQTYLNTTEDNPTGPASGNSYTIRGGSLYDAPYNVRTTARTRLPQSERHSNIGFRVAK